MSSSTELNLPEIMVTLTPDRNLHIIDYSKGEKHVAQLLSDLAGFGIETEFITRGWCG